MIDLAREAEDPEETRAHVRDAERRALLDRIRGHELTAAYEHGCSDGRRGIVRELANAAATGIALGFAVAVVRAVVRALNRIG